MRAFRIFALLILSLLVYTVSAQDIIMTAGTVDINCSANQVFKDPGGDADYPGLSNIEMTLCAGIVGQEVSVSFTSFATEQGFDVLTIYEGAGTGGTLIGAYSGSELQGQTIASTGSGCLTFVFESDWFTADAGWEADVSCVFGCLDFTSSTNINSAAPPAVLDICINTPFDINTVGNYPNSPGDYVQSDATSIFTWDFGDGDVQVGQNQNKTYSTVGNYTINLTVEDANGCIFNEDYEVNVTCGGACADPCTDFFPGDSTVYLCSGTFWDSGQTGGFSNDENDIVTFCADNGGRIKLNFSMFDLGSNSHHLIIFDGEDTGAPLIGNYTVDNPVSLTQSVESSGTCLTVKFTSNSWGTTGNGWVATISCSHPCQEVDLGITSNPPINNGVVYTCPGSAVDFTTNLTFPENNTDYTQTIPSTSVSWSAYNGASGFGTTFILPADSSFITEVLVDAVDVNGCHATEVISVVSECQDIDLEILTDATIAQNGEIFLPFGTPISLSSSYAFPESGSCYDQALSELTWTFGLSDVGTGAVIESHAADTVIDYQTTGVYEITLTAVDNRGCETTTSVEVHVGCQPVDVTWTGTPTMLGDTILVCPGDSFSIEIFTDYFANNESYFQEDANMIFNWNMADGTLISNQMNPGMHMYENSGMYNVYVQIVDTNSGANVPCPDNTYIPVYAFEEPSMIGTMLHVDTVCYGDSLLLTGNTTLEMPSYSAPPVFLPDGSGVSYTSTLTFDMFGDEILTDVNDFMSLCMNLEHSYTGDLRLEIECPNGQITELLPYPNGCGGHHLGEPCDNFGTSTIGVGYDYCFTPAATATIPDNLNLFTHDFTDNDGNDITSQSYFPAGDYAPTGTFNDLLGCPLNGDWTLHITDNLGSDDGMIFDWSITLNVEGLIPPDTIQLPLQMREWSVSTGNGAVINVIGNSDDAYATPLDTGLYEFTFTTTSPAGCVYDTVVGPVYVAPVPQWTLGDDDFVCAGYDYSIPGTLVDGTGTWSAVGPGNAVFSDPNNIPTDVTVDVYGDYTFYFTPNTIALCADPDSIQVSFHELPTVSELIDSVNCWGACDGSVTVTPLGVELPYSYLWSNGDDTNVSDSLCVGDVQLTVTTDFCSNFYNFYVPQPLPVMVVDSGKVDNLCFADSNGEAWVSAEGGTPGYNYSWEPTNTNDSLITGLYDGTYRVTVSDHYGCEAFASVTVNGPLQVLTIDEIIPTHIACSGEANGFLEPQVSGGTQPYSYNWILAGGGTSSNEVPTGLEAGTYFVTVTDANNCVETGNQTLTEPTQLVVSHFEEPTTCFGYNDGKIWVEPTGATPPYSYEWSNGWQDSVIVNSAAGFYNVTITDSRGCNVVFEELEVLQPNQVMVAIPSTSPICIGESQELIMSVTSSPFTPYSYFWNGVAGGESIVVTPSETTIYTAQVIDAHGCESLVMNAEVEVYQPLSSEISFDKTEVCKGEVITVNVEVNGGNGNTIYTLDNGQQVDAEFSIQAEETKEYSLTISDNCSTPPVVNTFEIVVNQPYLPSFHADVKVGCNPLTVNFLQDTEGHGEGTEYLWTFGDFGNNSISYETDPTHIFSNDGNFDVVLEITTPENCKSSKIEYDYITVFPNPEAQFVATPSIAYTTNPNVYFENQSIGADLSLWNFGDGDTTYAWSVTHEYPNVMNSYEASLVAVTKFGCTDTARTLIKIVDEITFHMPTGFTPDDDGLNEVFKPQGNGIVNEDYSMIIYNRWGELIFESSDINIGWDGKAKDGSMATVGIYSYVIRFVDTYGVPHERSGQVNLIR